MKRTGPLREDERGFEVDVVRGFCKPLRIPLAKPPPPQTVTMPARFLPFSGRSFGIRKNLINDRRLAFVQLLALEGVNVRPIRIPRQLQSLFVRFIPHRFQNLCP
ncbi:unnamed protein product [Amoebophrya sp. A25]|nr:unnamed protein product [Amoebophrya sp. A25]|eukprot:GSA25T00026308001.1